MKKGDFFRWANLRRGMHKDDVLKLRLNDREKLFLVWKWGYSDDNANAGLESSRRDIMMSIRRDTDDFYYQEMIKFEDYCFEIKKELGLVKEKTRIDYIIEERFGGSN